MVFVPLKGFKIVYPGNTEIFGVADILLMNNSVAVPATGNFVFTTGDRNASRADLGNRRYVAVTAAIQAGEVPQWPYSERTLRQRLQDTALKLKPRNDAPMAWIIEREGRVTMVHYENCAKRAAENGYTVTPYYSKVMG